MDETETKGKMGTSVPAEIALCADLVSKELDASVYLTGGALLPHETQDYDLMVYTELETEDVLRRVQEFCTATHVVDSLVVTECYQKDPETWRMIAKITYMDYKVDLLILHQESTVKDIMKRYPLSIQKQALWLAGPCLYDTTEVYHHDFLPVDDKLIVVHKIGSHVDKYRKYYPDHGFLLLPGS